MSTTQSRSTGVAISARLAGKRRLAKGPAVLALTVAAFLLASCSAPPVLKGTVLDSPQLASDFTLVDQHGKPFRLWDARGKVVVLSFMYTHCTDICPFETLKIRAAIRLLGDDARDVVFVAVTTDPARDTQQVIADYSRAAGLFDAWHFLTGAMDAVKQVWNDYGIGVIVEGKAAEDPEQPTGVQRANATSSDAPSSDVSPTQGLSSADLGTAAVLVNSFGGGYEVSHTAPFWFIDKAGKLRATMDADALPADMVYDIRALMRGR